MVSYGSRGEGDGYCNPGRTAYLRTQERFHEYTMKTRHLLIT